MLAEEVHVQTLLRYEQIVAVNTSNSLRWIPIHKLRDRDLDYLVTVRYLFGKIFPQSPLLHLLPLYI